MPEWEHSGQTRCVHRSGEITQHTGHQHQRFRSDTIGGARLLSICSGSVVLAASGLLDGKRMITHWRFAAQVQQRFPHRQVDARVLYVDEGSLLTSAGSASGLDLCLYKVSIAAIAEA